MVHEEERLVAIPPVAQPVERDVGDRVRGVLAVVFHGIVRPVLGALPTKLWIVVFALAGQNAVVITPQSLSGLVPA